MRIAMSSKMMKLCPKCNELKSKSQFPRHLRSCKGPAKEKVMCKYCGGSFRKSYFKRHALRCKFKACVLKMKNGESNRTAEALKENEILRKSLEESLLRNHALTSEKAELVKEKAELAMDKADLTMRLCSIQIESKDKINELQTLMVRKELEYTQQLASLSHLSIVHNHYNHYALHMTPWCLDNTHPAYNKTLAEDVTEYKQHFVSLPSRSSIMNDYDMQYDTIRRQNMFSHILKAHRLSVPKPYYIILDVARRKGLFVMPDGSVRVDPGMVMILKHQYAIGNGIDSKYTDWYFILLEQLNCFKNMIRDVGGTNASRLKKECSNYE